MSSNGFLVFYSLWHMSRQRLGKETAVWKINKEVWNVLACKMILWWSVVPITSIAKAALEEGTALQQMKHQNLDVSR